MMTRLTRRRANDSGFQRPRRPLNERRLVGLRPWLESLEDRTVLSTITWNTSNASTGGNWDVAANWNGGVVPGPNDTAEITGLTSPGTVYLGSGNADEVDSITTDSTTTLDVITGSLSLGTASSSSIGGALVISPGATLNVGPGASVAIAAGQTLTDNGSLTLALPVRSQWAAR
jgi:hypothetical protein